MARMKGKDKHDSGKRRSPGSGPLLVKALRQENQRLLQRIASLEMLCTIAHNRIKVLETELDPHAPEKLTSDELEAVIHAVLETNRPLRRKPRQGKKPF